MELAPHKYKGCQFDRICIIYINVIHNLIIRIAIIMSFTKPLQGWNLLVFMVKRFIYFLLIKYMYYDD